MMSNEDYKYAFIGVAIVFGLLLLGGLFPQFGGGDPCYGSYIAEDC